MTCSPQSVGQRCEKVGTSSTTLSVFRGFVYWWEAVPKLPPKLPYIKTVTPRLQSVSNSYLGYTAQRQPNLCICCQHMTFAASFARILFCFGLLISPWKSFLEIWCIQSVTNPTSLFIFNTYLSPCFPVVTCEMCFSLCPFHCTITLNVNKLTSNTQPDSATIVVI